MDKFRQVIVILTSLALLSACVSQNYKSDDTPVVQNNSTNDDIALTRISLGLGYLKMGNTTQAKLNLEKAKRFAPRLVQVYTAFAHYYETVGESEQASAAYQQALSLKADDADTLNNYGVFLCRQQRLEEAEKQFLKAIAVPSYILVAQSYENLALCHLKSDNFKQAEGFLEKAILHNPGRAAILLQMVSLQYAKGDYHQAQLALQKFEKAVRRFTPKALALAFKVYQKQGKKGIANNYAVMLVKMFPASWQSKQYLLNELVQIPADELALRYEKSIQGLTTKKRIVVLSPPDKASLEGTPESAKEQIKAEEIVVIETTELVSQQKELLSAARSKVKPDSKAVKDKQTTITIPVHVVEYGDSLFSISKKYNIYMRSIQRWNNIKESSVIRVGDVIYLSNPTKVAKS